jgi:hypothetical protein
MNITVLQFTKSLKFLTVLIIWLPLIVNAQRINLKSAWTDGDIVFYPDKIENGVVHFFGGSLHDGGNMFCLHINTNGQLAIYDKGDECASGAYLYQNIELKIVNGIQVLLLRDKAGNIVDFFRQVYPDQSLLSLITATKTNHELAGKYVNPVTGKTIIFNPDNQTVSGLTNLTDYIFEEEYDSPSDVITFKNKKSYMYEITEKGLDIYIAKHEDPDPDWLAGKKVMSLVKTEWLNTDSLKNVPGKYPFASRELLITGTLSCYSSTKLALMRNEIYARHGFNFKSRAKELFREAKLVSSSERKCRRRIIGFGKTQYSTPSLV